MELRFSEYPPEFAYVDARPPTDDIGVRLTFALVNGFKAPSQTPLQVDRFAEQPLRRRGLRKRLGGEREQQADGEEPACARSCETPPFGPPNLSRSEAAPIFVAGRRHLQSPPVLALTNIRRDSPDGGLRQAEIAVVGVQLQDGSIRSGMASFERCRFQEL